MCACACRFRQHSPRALNLSCRACLQSITFFFFNDTATTEIYTLSLHDALPISAAEMAALGTSAVPAKVAVRAGPCPAFFCTDRKSTRLNSSHLVISYAVFCLKKKNLAVT